MDLRFAFRGFNFHRFLRSSEGPFYHALQTVNRNDQSRFRHTPGAMCKSIAWARPNDISYDTFRTRTPRICMRVETFMYRALIFIGFTGDDSALFTRRVPAKISISTVQNSRPQFAPILFPSPHKTDRTWNGTCTPDIIIIEYRSLLSPNCY